MRPALPRLVDTVVVVCIVALTGTTLWNTFRSATPVARSIHVDSTAKYQDASRRLGLATARTSLTVWTDYECPAGGRFEKDLAIAATRVPGGLMIYYRPFPNRTAHPRGYRASLLAECARGVDRFEVTHKALFALNLPGRGDFPEDSLIHGLGLDTIPQFQACQDGQVVAALVDSAVADGFRLGLAGTPSVMVGHEITLGGMVPDQLVKALEE